MNNVLMFDQSSSQKFIKSLILKSLQFFHLMKTFIWASRRSRFGSDSCSWNINWSRWDCWSLATVWCLDLANYIHVRVSPFWHDRQTTTDSITKFLQESDKLVYGSLHLLAPGWTVVKRALSRRSHRRIPRHTNTKTPYLCRGIPPGRSFQ